MRLKVLFLAGAVASNFLTAIIVLNLQPARIPIADVPESKPCPQQPPIVVYRPTIGEKPVTEKQPTQTLPPSHDQQHQQQQQQRNKTSAGPTIFMISPTHARVTQKSDLTSLCYTIMHVPNLVWIVIEDSDHRSQLVANLLARCKVRSVHLNAVTPEYYKHDKWKPRGVLQRNAGLRWIREHHSTDNCSGVVYFGDDDNSYDLRVFEKMRETKRVSVWPVAFTGGVIVEGPICKDGVIDKWHNGWAPERPFPIDMGGFAIHLCLLMEHPTVLIGRDKNNHLTKPGYLESNLLEQLITKDSLECRGPPNELIVWHVKTEKPDISREPTNPSDPKIEV